MTDSNRPALTYIRWVFFCGAAELLGLTLAVTWWIMVDRFDPEPVAMTEKVAMLAAKSLAGAGEGVVLGIAQGVMLRQLFTRLDLRAWVTVTVLIAVFGWAAGSAVSIFGGFSADAVSFEPPFLWVIVFAALFGVIAGALFGAAQWVALRQVAEPASVWIVANAAGWAVAMPVIYVAASLDYGGRGVVPVFAVSLVAGMLAGAAVGALTGLSFRWLQPAGARAATRDAQFGHGVAGPREGLP